MRYQWDFYFVWGKVFYFVWGESVYFGEVLTKDTSIFPLSNMKYNYRVMENYGTISSSSNSIHSCFGSNSSSQFSSLLGLDGLLCGLLDGLLCGLFFGHCRP